MANVLLSGVTGRIGRAVAQTLAADGKHNLTGLVRQLQDDSTESALPYQPVLGDFADTQSLTQALADVSSALLVSNVHPDQCALQGNFVDAAAAMPQPISLVKISGLGSQGDSAVDSGRWHATTEAYMREKGLTAHSLHPYFFMQNLAFALAQAKNKGVLSSGVDGDAPIAMVDARDIAAVAARLLVEPDCCADSVLPLTGTRSYSYREVAELMSQVLEREVVYQEQTETELRRALGAAGEPEWHVDIIIQFNAAFAAGLGGTPSHYVETISGQTPRKLPAYLTEVVRSETQAAGRNPFPNS